MSEADAHEQELRMAWLDMQMEKAVFDINMELRKLKRQTWTIVLTGVGIVVAAFAAGAAWMNYIWHHTP